MTESTADTPTDATPDPTPRSTGAVLGILGMLAILAIVAILVVVLVSGSGGGAGADVAAEARANRVQAVYMSNDRVFFGTLEARDGDWVELSDAFYLRRAAADTAAKDADAAAATTEVVPVSQEVGGDGNLVLNATEIVLVQNLQADSDIARTVEDARE